MPTKEELAQPARKAGADFYSCFIENRIWLDKVLADQVQAFISRLNQAAAKFRIYVRHGYGREDQRFFERWEEAWDEVSKDVPMLREQLESSFREMLGIKGDGAGPKS